jgi:glycerol kinase
LFISYFRIDGGVSQNDFVVQTISTLMGTKVQRSATKDVGAFGVAFLAGYETGMFYMVSRFSVSQGCDSPTKPTRLIGEAQCKMFPFFVRFAEYVSTESA